MPQVDQYGAADAESNVARWYDDTHPKVSIVVLNYNKAELTAECLSAIWKNTTGVTYEVIVVDNGSRAEEFAKLALRPGAFQLFRTGQNRFFGEGNNIGAELGKGELICFLNNDAFVTPDWLTPLCEVLEGAWNAGGVGPRFMYPDGRLQEVGAFVDGGGYSCQAGKYGLFEPTDTSVTRIVDYCSAACLLVRKSEFEEVGGFDLTFEPAYYEDADLCFKIGSLGRFIYCCPKSLVIHVESATTATHRDVLGDQTVEMNRKIFTLRWKKFLDDRISNRDADLTLSKLPSLMRSRGDAGSGTTAKPSRRVAFYTPYDLTPGGGERYLLSAAAAATAMAEVFLVTEHPYSQLRLTSLSRELSIDVSGITMVSRDRLSSVVPVDVCIIMANEIIPPIAGFGRYNYFLCQFPFPISDADLAARWPNLATLDEYLCYSNFVHHFVRQDLLKLIRREKSITVIAPPVPQVSVLSDAQRQKAPIQILLIGRFFVGGHNKRHDVGIELIRLLNNRGYDLELHLVGSISANHAPHRHHLQHLRQSAEGLNVHFHPNASSDTLGMLLRSCTIYLHATGFEVDPTKEPHRCEHFGISVLEAMSAGCIPFVVDNGGPAEFVRNGYNGFTYSTLDDLALKVQILVDNLSMLDRLRGCARDTAAQFSEEVFLAEWHALLRPHLGDEMSTTGPHPSSLVSADVTLDSFRRDAESEPGRERS